MTHTLEKCKMVAGMGTYDDVYIASEVDELLKEKDRIIADLEHITSRVRSSEGKETMEQAYDFIITNRKYRELKRELEKMEEQIEAQNSKIGITEFRVGIIEKQINAE